MVNLLSMVESKNFWKRYSSLKQIKSTLNILHQLKQLIHLIQFIPAKQQT